MESIIVSYIILAVAFSITFYLRFVLEALKILKDYEKVYCDIYTANITYHLGFIIGGTLYFPLLLIEFFRERNSVIKNLAMSIIASKYGNKK